MNTNIIRILFDCKDKTALYNEANKLVSTHNDAVRYGLIDSPILVFCNIHLNNDVITITVNTHSGIAILDDVYNIKSLWGADEVWFTKDGIEFIFER